MAQGKLDKKGHAQVKSSLPGIFVVTFPDLDGADGDGDGALELPPEEDRSEASRHTVKQGERMATIATQYKFLRWQTLWDFAGNSDLKDLRKNPNILFPDNDEVAIPAKLKRQAEVVGGKAKYVVQTGAEVLRIRFAEGESTEGEIVKFTATPDGGDAIPGKLDPDGTMEIDLPPNTKKVFVELFYDNQEVAFCSYELHVGHLDPFREVPGIEARLANLGYDHGAIDGDTEPVTTSAIAQFRAEHGLSPGDQIDDDLAAAARGLHDTGEANESGEASSDADAEQG
jgi:N-acetylmuramoyl-L-alanine amidase